jgi:hypothetical protein
MITIRRLNITGMVLAMLLLVVASGMAATRVELDGRAMSFDVAPIQVAGRTMVPMRAIFEALGASVQWTDSTQTVMARRDTTDVQLTIGESSAQVNGRSVALDVPAMIYRGATMVPLRFVSETLGADVRWSDATQTVSIFTTGAPTESPNGGQDPNWNQDPNRGRNPNRGRPRGAQTITIPRGTVVPVRLDRRLSSSADREGDMFSVTVRSSREGDAEFPRGTTLAGTIVGVERAGHGRPGTLDLAFREAMLPDGSNVRIDGSVISLDGRTVTRSREGRLAASAEARKDRQKMIGIGAGAGLIVGKILNGGLIKGGLLGAAAGYVYSERTKDQVQYSDVIVDAGTEFGVRLDSDVSFRAPRDFISARDSYRGTR